MSKFYSVPVPSVGVKKVPNPLPESLTPFFHVTDGESALQTQILQKNNRNQKEGQEKTFKTVLEEKAEAASLIFCQVCVIFEESVVFCLIDCLAINCREEPECWPAGQQFFISAIWLRAAAVMQWCYSRTQFDFFFALFFSTGVFLFICLTRS